MCKLALDRAIDQYIETKISSLVGPFTSAKANAVNEAGSKLRSLSHQYWRTIFQIMCDIRGQGLTKEKVISFLNRTASPEA